MSIELIQEWVDIFTAKGGKLVAPREIRELAANNTKYKVYEWLYNKAAHTAGWQPFEQGLRKGKLYLQRGELIASIRRIAKGCRLSLSQTHAVVAFLVGHWFIEQRTEQSIIILSICNYKHHVTFDNDKPNGKPNGTRTAPERQPDGSYIISIGSEELTNDITNDITKEEEKSDSLKVESPLPEPSSKEKTKKQPPPGLSLEDFIFSLKENPAYSWMSIDTEVGKMKAWLQTPKGSHRKFTKRFILNWLNKIEKPFETTEASMNRQPSSIECPFENYRAQDPMGGSTRKFEPEKIQRSDDPEAVKRAQAIVQELTERKTKPSVYWPKFKSEPESVQRDGMTSEAKELRKAELRRQAEVLNR